MSNPINNEHNKSILITMPGSDQVMVVIAMVLAPDDLDVEKMLAALVPEMAKGRVRGGMLVLGDSTLLLRLEGEEMLVDEVDTTELLTLADIDQRPGRKNLPSLMLRWVAVISEKWRDRIVGRLRPMLVPHLVAGLRGDVQVVDGIWGTEAHRLPQRID